MKKLISTALVVAMFATMTTIPALAAEADYANSGILGYIDFEDNFDLSTITTNPNFSIVTDKDDPTNHVLKLTAPKKGESTASILFGDKFIAKNMAKDAVYNVSFKAYTVAENGTEPSKFTFYTQNTKLDSSKANGHQETHKVVEMNVSPEKDNSLELSAKDSVTSGTKLKANNTKGIGNFTTAVYSDWKTEDLETTEYKLTNVNIKLDFKNNKVSARTYDKYKKYSGTDNTSSSTLGREVELKNGTATEIDLISDVEYLDVLRFGIEAKSTDNSETVYTKQAELYIDDIRIEQVYSPNSVEGFELGVASSKNWTTVLGTGGTVSYANKHAEITIPQGTVADKTFAMQNYVKTEIDPTKIYEFGYQITVPVHSGQLRVRNLINARDNDGGTNGAAKEFNILTLDEYALNPEESTTYTVNWIVDPVNKKLNYYIDGSYVDQREYTTDYDLDAIWMLQAGIRTKQATTAEYKIAIDNLYFRELENLAIINSDISTSAETAFFVNDGIVITFSNTVNDVKKTAPNNSADQTVKLYKEDTELSASITYPNPYSIKIDAAGGFEQGETYTVKLAKELYGKSFTYAPLGKDVILNYTASADDALEMSIEAVTGGYNINITNAGSEVTGATLIIASYDSVTNRLEDVEIIGENVTIPTTGYVSDTPIELSVPQNGCVKAFLFDNLENITPLCENAEL